MSLRDLALMHRMIIYLELQVKQSAGGKENYSQHAFWKALMEAKRLLAMDKYFPRQDSTEDQLRDVLKMANKMGCYDAADVISQFLKSKG